MFNFTPLLGAQSASAASQSLLELDGGVKILVDVGWDERFDAAQLQALEKHVSTLSVILLTHATIDHIGAYAHCCKHVPGFAKVPVYATTPVVNLGRTLAADTYASTPLAASTVPPASISVGPLNSNATPNLLLPAPTPDDVASYFSAIHPLKYSQPHQPLPSPWSPPLGNLTITAYSAGHTPGGTIWHIQHSLESIVYAADWNQGRENLLSGAAWLGGSGAGGGGAEIIEPLRRPTALVCSSKGVEKTDTLPRKKRDETLISLIRETIAQGGKVLIPTDSSARVLELAFILNHTWRENITGPHADTYRHAKIYMASKSSTSTVRQLQSMLEWMDDTIIRDAEAAMNKAQGDDKAPNLLDWKFVKQIERQSQFDRALRRKRPCIILASDASMDWGYSRQALEKLAADSRNLVVLTETASETKSSHSSIASQLADTWRASSKSSSQSGAKVVDADGRSVLVRDASVEDLTTEEDMLYQQYIARQRQMHSTQLGDNTENDVTSTEIADQEAEDSSESEDEDEDPEHQGRALNLSAQMTQSNKRKTGVSEAELGINVLLRSKNVHDYDVRNKRGREKMFPFVSRRPKNDDYGDIIKPEDYLRAEERDDVDGVDMRDGARPSEATVGQKRKWDDATNPAEKKGAKKPKQEKPPKPPKVEREPDDIDALIARATGVTNEGGEGAGANGAVSEESSDSESDCEPEESVDQQRPQKLVFAERTISLQLRIAHINFSGLHEKRDLQMLIPLIRPRKLILISGDVSETQTLAQECRQLLEDAEAKSTDVLAPVSGETVDASVDTNSWSLKLSRQLVKKLTWQEVKGLGVVALTGRLDAEPLEVVTSAAGEEAARKKQKLSKKQDDDEGDIAPKPTALPAVPVLDLLATTASTVQQRVTQPVHVGDLRLADLRRLMQASGHTAEFRGEGTLLIDSTVVVRKSVTGKIEVEAGQGGLSQPTYRTKENEGSFYAVRKLIYGGLAVVAGV